MNEPIDFNQDPERPDGTGTFRFQDGSELYAMDPDLAKRIRTRLDSAPDRRLAQNDQPKRFGTGAQDAALNLDPDYARDLVTPATGGAPQRVGGFEIVQEPEKPAQPAPAPAQPVPRKPPPRPMVAGRDPAREAASLVPVPRSTSTVIKGVGGPYSQEDAEQRSQLSQNYQMAKLAEYDTQIARLQEEAAMHRAALPALKQKEAEQNAQLSRLDAVYQNDRAAVQEHIAAFDKQAKPDSRRLFKNSGTLANIGMVIAQALGAYSAAITHTDNYAQKIVQSALDRDYQEQLDEIREGRISNNNMLAQLHDQFGNLDQARTALKLIQSEIVDREIKSFAAAAKSQEAAGAAATWLAQNQLERQKLEQEFKDRSFSEVTTTTQADLVAPRAARPMTDEELMAKQTKENRARAALLESENEIGYQREGGEQAGKLAKRKGEAAPNDELYVEGYGYAKTKKEAIELRAAIAEHGARDKELDETGQLSDKTWAKIGVTVPGWVPFLGGAEFGSKEYTKAGQLAERSATATARSYGGPITQSDRDSAKLVTPDARRLTGNQKTRIESARQASDELLRQQIRAIVSGQHPDLPESRKVEE